MITARVRYLTARFILTLSRLEFAVCCQMTSKATDLNSSACGNKSTCSTVLLWYKHAWKYFLRVSHFKIYLRIFTKQTLYQHVFVSQNLVSCISPQEAYVCWLQVLEEPNLLCLIRGKFLGGPYLNLLTLEKQVSTLKKESQRISHVHHHPMSIGLHQRWSKIWIRSAVWRSRGSIKKCGHTCEGIGLLTCTALGQ